jgi:tetratricopeptide (TPR) repeat protein
MQDDLRAGTETAPPRRSGDNRRLTGWKEIGAFFGKTERTVKRWESRGLPVHRAPGGAKAAVFAYTGELEAWLRTGNGVVSEDSEPVPETAPETAAPAIETPLVSPTVQPVAPTRRPGRMLLAAGLAAVLVAGLAAFLLRDRFETGRHTPSAAVAALVQSGLYHWNTRTPDGLKTARDEFTAAIAQDPDYAEAHAGLAKAYNLMAQYGVMKPAEAYPLARAEAETAIALDPDLASGYGALGFASFYGFKDLPRAAALFRKALALDPNSALGWHWYALIMMHTGRFEEPLRAIDRAQALDSNSHAIRANRGLILFYAGRTEEALTVLQDLTRSAPNLLSPHYYLATIYLDQQRYDDYLAESLTAAKLEGNTALQAAIEAGAQGYRADGAKGLFAAMLAVQQSELKAGQETAFNVARTAALLGDHEMALQSLRQSQLAGESDLLGIRVDPSFKTLRDDARFQSLAANVLALPADDSGKGQ